MSGYGVELAIKSTEYKAKDDTKVDGSFLLALLVCTMLHSNWFLLDKAIYQQSIQRPPTCDICSCNLRNYALHINCLLLYVVLHINLMCTMHIVVVNSSTVADSLYRIYDIVFTHNVFVCFVLKVMETGQEKRMKVAKMKFKVLSSQH